MKIFNLLKNLAQQRIQIARINGYQSSYLSSAGTTTLQLVRGVVYLVVVTRLNTSTANYQGMYFVQAHSQPSINTIFNNTAATVTINSSSLLTVTTTQNYCNVIAIPLMNL